MEVLRVDEGEPQDRPIPEGLSPAAAAVDDGMIWSRLEDWIAHRWGERPVKWIINGPGVWVPRLRPTATPTFETWDGDAWAPATVKPAPLGYALEAETYKVTATVGSTATPPDSVREAYRRLAEYYADNREDVGRTSVSDGDYSFDRSANAVARAMQYSGAADLLRGYRR